MADLRNTVPRYQTSIQILPTDSGALLSRKLNDYLRQVDTRINELTTELNILRAKVSEHDGVING